MQAGKAQLQTLSRLKNRVDFLKIQSKGQKWVSHGLIVQILENDLGIKRVGFTVSKKVSNSAVKRNRIKRRLRSVAAEILPGQAKDSCDYILVGRTETTLRPYEQLKNEVLWCMRKTGFVSER